MSRTQLRRALPGALALAATALAAAACGGSSSSARTTAATAATGGTTTSARGPGNAAFTAYRDCLSQHGVTLPTGGFRGGNGGPPTGTGATPPTGTGTTPPAGAPPTGTTGGGRGLPAGVDAKTFAAAQEACASKRPAGGFGGPGGGGPRLDSSALAAFRACLTSHGVKLPAGTQGFRQLDRTDAKVKAALATCNVLLPNRGQRPGTGTTTTAS